MLGTGQRIPDAAEQPAAGRFVLVEHVVETWGAQVRVGNDPTDQMRRVARRLPGNEPRLTDGREVRVAVVVRGPALDKDGPLDTMSRVRVVVELGEPVRQDTADGPEVMVGIDDRKVGI